MSKGSILKNSNSAIKKSGETTEQRQRSELVAESQDMVMQS